MKKNAVNALGFVEAHVRPCVAAVERFVDAVADARTVAGIALARANPDDGRILLIDCDRADSRDRLAVEDRLERRAAVHGLPDAADGDADINNVGIGSNGLDIGDAAAHAGRTDAAGFHAGEVFGVELCKRAEREYNKQNDTQGETGEPAKRSVHGKLLMLER